MKSSNPSFHIAKTLVLLGIGASLFNDSIACTTIIVGKGATTDGSILIGRSVDTSTANKAVRFVYHKPRKQSYVFKSIISNKFTYQMPANSMGYSGVPDWNTNNSTYEEVGFNDAGVGISATETIFSHPQMLNVDPYIKTTGIGEEAIPSVLLPQIKSARHGVEILGKIIEQSGSSEGFGVVFVDKKEVWYLENAGGHQWVAVRVPDDSYFVSANQSRIGEVDLNDSKNFLASKDLIHFAVKHGFYDPTQDGKFVFSSVYGADSARDMLYNYPRIIELQTKYTTNTQSYEINDNEFPVFLKPDHKLSVTDVEHGLQMYYQGSIHDPYTTQNPQEKYRPISVYRTQQSHVMQIRDQLPLPIANVEYLSLGMAALSTYVPFYQGAKIPLMYQMATNTADNTSAYWKFRKLQALAMMNFPKYAPIIHQKFAALNIEIKNRQKQFEHKYVKLYAKNPRRAQKLLDAFTVQTVGLVFNAVDELTNQLFTEQSAHWGDIYSFAGA
jgi:dipeptidase